MRVRNNETGRYDVDLHKTFISIMHESNDLSVVQVSDENDRKLLLSALNHLGRAIDDIRALKA